ncbi:BatA domain-containing protein [Pirellulaceae bacterium SH449]
MTFLNAILAFGTLAFTVPLVIHLLNRSQFRVVEWGAMSFLELQPQLNTRRIEWRHLLLLLLRCLIPIFLALAMARPFISGWSMLGTSEPIALAIVIDDSLSMQSKGTDGQTRWQIAGRETDQLIRSLPKGSDVQLILAGNPPIACDTTNRELLFEQWQTRPSVTGPADWVAATRLALDWCNRQPLTRRQIVLLSDFQKNDWVDQPDIGTDLEQLIGEQIIAPILSMVNVASSEGLGSAQVPLTNYSIGDVVLNPRWIAEGQSITAACTIYNHSANPVESLEIVSQLDDQRIDSQTINIAPHSTSKITLRFPARSIGWHVLKVEIPQKDDLEFDNVKQVPFLVQAKSPVVLIDGNLRQGPMESESDFLRLALAPFSFTTGAGSDYFDGRVMTMEQWRGRSGEPAQAIAVCNVPVIDSDASQKMRLFVENGDGIIVFLGNRVDQDSWNRLPSVQDGGIRFVTINAYEDEQTPSATKPVAIDVERLQATLFEGLSQASRDSLRSISINRHTSLSPLPNTKPDQIAYFTNGEPWILRHTVGQGSIWIVSTSCNEVDTNLPSRPVFVPLVQRLFHTVAGSIAAMEVIESGSPWFMRFFPKRPSDQITDTPAITIRTPRRTEELSVERDWDDTRQIGFYQAEWQHENNRHVSYSWVQPRRSSHSKHSESDRSDSDADQFGKLASEIGAQHFSSVERLLARGQQTWKGREIGTWFWLAAMGCFLAEMLVAQSFSRRRILFSKGTS